jgi:hypothetical protein
MSEIQRLQTRNILVIENWSLFGIWDLEIKI